MNESKKQKFKVCIFGDRGVGKKSIICSLIEGKFSCTSQIQPEIYEKGFLIDGRGLTLQLWRSICRENSEFIKKMYFKGTKGGLLVIYISQISTFNSMEKWIQVFKNSCRSKPLLLIGNNVDLPSHRRAFFYEETLEVA